MYCRYLLMCIFVIILSVIFVKTHVIKRRSRQYAKLNQPTRWKSIYGFDANGTRVTAKIWYYYDYPPTTTRQRRTMPPELEAINPVLFNKPVTGRNPLLVIKDPRPELVNSDTYIEPTFIEREYYKYNVTLKEFHFALTIVILAGQYADQRVYVEHSLTSSYYYNKIYRVMLKYISSAGEWLSGTGSYTDTQELWRKKLHYVTEFVPTWLRSYIPWVSTSEWTKEEDNFMKFHDRVELKPIFIKNPYYQGKGTYWEES